MSCRPILRRGESRLRAVARVPITLYYATSETNLVEYQSLTTSKQSAGLLFSAFSGLDHNILGVSYAGVRVRPAGSITSAELRLVSGPQFHRFPHRFPLQYLHVIVIL